MGISWGYYRKEYKGVLPLRNKNFNTSRTHRGGRRFKAIILLMSLHVMVLVSIQKQVPGDAR